MSRYFIVSRPCYYGDSVRVVSGHKNIELAMRAIKGKTEMYIVRRGNMIKGDRFFRCYEDLYPIANGQ